MKKYTGSILGGIVVLAFILYFILSGQNSGTVATVPASGSAAGIADIGQTSTSGTTTATTAAGTPPTPSASAYKDGTYTGPIADALYGKLEVVVTIQGGKITNTVCPIYPNDGGHTQEVSQTALPQLKQEAIASQSANVDIVSGATQTSQAYQQSLAAALAQAKS